VVLVTDKDGKLQHGIDETDFMRLADEYGPEEAARMIVQRIRQ